MIEFSLNGDKNINRAMKKVQKNLENHASKILNEFEKKIEKYNKYIEFYENNLTQESSDLGTFPEMFLEYIWKEETGGYVKKETFTAINPKGDPYDFSVDRHCYIIGDELKMVVECKIYCDKPMFERACSNFHFMKASLNKAVDCVVFSMQDAMGDKARKFFMGLGDVDHYFVLIDERRDSNKQIWKEEHKPELSIDKLEKFINYVNTLK